MAKKKPAQEVAATPPLSFKHEGKTYQFVIKKFKLARVEVTADEALKNPAICSELVAIQSSIIKLID